VNVETQVGHGRSSRERLLFRPHEALDANNFFANATGCQEENFGDSTTRGPLWGGRCLGQENAPFSLFSYQAIRDVNAASLEKQC